MEQIRQIPYGVSDFRSVRESNLYYVDKTMYIKALEDQARTKIFNLQRRFGNSLFINMMRLYYDKLEAGKTFWHWKVMRRTTSPAAPA